VANTLVSWNWILCSPSCFSPEALNNEVDAGRESLHSFESLLAYLSVISRKKSKTIVPDQFPMQIVETQ